MGKLLGHTLPIGPCYIKTATMPPIEKQARVDGDTYWMILDLGHRTLRLDKIRLKDVDAPETEKDPIGAALAKNRALQELYSGKPLLVETFKLTNDRYEGIVWVGGKSLAETLLFEGLVIPWKRTAEGE